MASPEPNNNAPKQVSASSSLDSFTMQLPTPDGDSEAVDNILETTAEDVDSPKVAAKMELHARPMLQAQPLLLPASSTNNNTVSVSAGATTVALNGSVPEFLFQLMKMLTDDNREIIEWSNGRIEVHSPQKLESTVLSRYFRHSKFASFQRQLNYFGFRKLAGKGKMSPCSYVNDSVQGDLSNLLLIKRKSGPSGSSKEAASSKKQRREKNPPTESEPPPTATPVNPVLADIVRASTSSAARRRSPRNTTKPLDDTPASVIARRAVGKGVRHGYVLPSTSSAKPSTSSAIVKNSLVELETNYKMSLHYTAASSDTMDDDSGGFPTFLSRNSSLVDLAIIPPPAATDDNNNDDGSTQQHQVETFNFVDFPYPEVDPLSCLDDATEDTPATNT